MRTLHFFNSVTADLTLAVLPLLDRRGERLGLEHFGRIA